MTTLVANTFNWIGLEKLAKWAVELNEARIRRADINTTIKQLSALTDRELNDMGISRCDIVQVAHGYDPRNSNDNLKGWV